MQVKVTPQEDGNTTLVVRKTRPQEGPSQLQRDVPPSEFEATLARMVAEVANEGT